MDLRMAQAKDGPGFSCRSCRVGFVQTLLATTVASALLGTDRAYVEVSS